ncbi:MAG: HlyC/CorC family transporter [Chloroflexi bacterium]|nr:HlyC/CorC family transporter [Chloroflexota bacterium]MBM4453216.1 HlyC/CorC family transporter [Chloroflexota bacterium]
MENINSLQIILFIVCLVLSAFFSSAETAFVALPKLRLKHLVSIKRRGAARLEKITAEPSRFLSAVLLGNNLVNIGAAALATVIAIATLGPAWGALAATIVVTLLILVFGEVIPKTIAQHYAEKVALAYVIPVQLVIWILYPFVWGLNHIGLRFTKLVREEEKPTISEEEFRTAISVGEEEGIWEEEEAEMLHSAFEFADRPVHEVMQPRTEVAWVEQGITLAKFLEVYRHQPFSRFPVYKKTRDNVVGVLSIKDVLMALANDKLKTDSSIDELVRPVHFVPETKRLGELLAEMRDNKYHIVVVVDEFGGTAGIATLEHLTAEIMGTIGDELAGKDEDIVTINANTFEVDGGLRIEDANEELDLDLPDGDYDTVAGFILSHLGRIPKQGEHLRYKDLKLAILEMRDRKIERILVTKEKDAAPAP